MQRLSIGRSLRLAFVALAIVLAVIAALGVAALYSARQRYENVLAGSSSLATAASTLVSDQIAEVELFRAQPGRAGAPARSQAASALAASALQARHLAAGDPPSAQLLEAELGAGAAAVRLAAEGRYAAAVGGPLTSARALAAQLQARQHAHQLRARATATSQSRRAVAMIAVAGLLALVAALGLAWRLVVGIRRPLDELVQATQAMAGGDLDRRVTAAGPRELGELGTAFNAMADELARARSRVEEGRRRLEITIASLGDGLIVTEAGSARIAVANPRAADLMPELKVGASTDDEHSPLPPLERALESELSVEHGGRMLAVTAARLGEAAQGVVWTLRDTTERARLERAKSDFVATASHELRSPLTSIKGFVELLHRSPEGLSERQREFVEIILRSTERLTELVADLLDVARIEADRVEIRRRPIDVGDAVHEVTELMGPQISAKRQALRVHVAPTAPLALADPNRVRQIVANLLTNAHLYTPPGGSIAVTVRPERAWVQIEVSDSGVGMTTEQTGRVFERFYRARNGASGSPGTGLGLSIVKSLVELHHGRIEITSEPGAGTTFRVLLPAVTVLDSQPRRMAETIRGKRVLVVDDDRDIAELVAGQLAPLGVHTEIVSGGEQALALLRQSRFDAVTLDVLMPQMDGFQVLREIRADVDLRDIPVVFVSVFSSRNELAGEWVVPKPIDADELRSVLAAAVQGGRSRVLVVGRPQLRPVLEPALEELGIEHQWELSGAAAAAVCAERRFEVALVDVGIRNPQAVLQALDLRGRRIRRAAILVSDGEAPAPPGIERLGLELVPAEQAAAAVLGALQGDRGPAGESVHAAE